MPGFENLIKRFVYSTTATKWCWIHGPWGSKTKYPCGVDYIEHTFGLYAGFSYPSVTPAQQTQIYSCAYTAGLAAYTSMKPSIGVCYVSAGIGCAPAVIANLPAANEVGRKVFYECLNRTDLPQSIKSQCTIGIYKKDL